ncbi:zinc ribbon domain-containing protein [Pseudomonadales bacterium]|nr:zinc ribbon domain-containing protein [Pseudomonadales bacterium]
MDPLALTPCPACEKPVSVRASACPNCGYKKPISEKLVHIVNNSEIISRIIKAREEITRRLPSVEQLTEWLILPIGWLLFRFSKWTQSDKIKQVFARDGWTVKKAFTFLLVLIYFSFGLLWAVVTGLIFVTVLLSAAAWLLGEFFGVS